MTHELPVRVECDCPSTSSLKSLATLFVCRRISVEHLTSHKPVEPISSWGSLYHQPCTASDSERPRVPIHYHSTTRHPSAVDCASMHAGVESQRGLQVVYRLLHVVGGSCTAIGCEQVPDDCMHVRRRLQLHATRERVNRLSPQLRLRHVGFPDAKIGAARPEGTALPSLTQKAAEQPIRLRVKGSQRDSPSELLGRLSVATGPDEVCWRHRLRQRSWDGRPHDAQQHRVRAYRARTSLSRV